jgi:hypothetical protein
MEFLSTKQTVKIISFFTLILSLSMFGCYADFTDNLRWSLDGSARLNQDDALDNTSQIYALGLDTHKIFTNDNEDVGYAVAQIYFTKIHNLVPVPFLFDTKNDNKFIIREAHINYVGGAGWLPNIRLGHFTLPFGLEEAVDTNGRLLDYYLGANLGTKLDWGIDFNKVIQQLEYSVSYTLGGKDKLDSIDGSYAVTARVSSLSHQDFVIGGSFFNGKIDGVSRKRVAIDWRYYWHTYGLFGELAVGEDDKLQGTYHSEKYALLEFNKTSFNDQLKLYSQLIFRDKAPQEHAEKLINIGLSYQFTTQFELSLAAMTQLDKPNYADKKQLARIQLRYRY